MTERTLSDRYRLEDRLGAGGTAVVYSGTDTLLRRRVAIKVLREQFAADDDFVRRFYSEAQHAAKLSHPNIVNIYDVGSEGDTYFIVMELVDGATLAEMIEHDGRIPEPVAIDYAAQICSGLAYAHRQGLLHRDIKPANILITKDDVVKLSDFGIARAVTTQTVTITQPGMVMGSVYYLSPEQAQGHELHETSDLYSLGIVLYQMLTGKLPYTGESPITVALKHISNPTPPLETEGGAISPALAAIVQRLMLKVPADRFGSATEVATALREAREHPLVAVPLPPAGLNPEDVPAAPRPKPRTSRLPDAPRDSVVVPSVEDDARDDATERSPGRGRGYAFIALALLAAVAAGYFLFSKPGGPFGAARTVALTNLTGGTLAHAQNVLAAERLKVNFTQLASETFARNRVIKQAPPPGTDVPEGSTVELVVSSGLPVVELQDLRQYSLEDAQRYLRNAKLKVDVAGKFDAAAKGTVLEQKPAAGSKVPIHSKVALVVSKGVQPIDVPNLSGLQLGKAVAVLAARGLKLQVAEKTPSAGAPANAVLSQDPAPGSPVNAGEIVTVVISSGAPQITVPDVSGQSVDDAAHSLRVSGLTPKFTYVVQPSGPSGVVIQQEPPSATPANAGATVTLSVAVPGVVPDVTGMTLDQARTALQNAGYKVGNIAYTQEGDEGKVVRTEPEANAELRPGEFVVIHFNGAPPNGAR